jgi:hypothetical protein
VRFIGHPEPGYYRLKLVRRGPWVPAVIWRPCPLVEPILYEMTPDPEDWCRPTERPRPLRGRIGDREADPFDIWTRARTISAVEYHWRLGLHEWAVDNAPEQPEAQPRRRVDLTDQPSLF